MTDTNLPPDQPSAEEVPTTPVEIAYNDASRLISKGDQAELALFSNLHRDPVRLEGVLKEPLRFREAMAALYAVVGAITATSRRTARHTSPICACGARRQAWRFVRPR